MNGLRAAVALPGLINSRAKRTEMVWEDLPLHPTVMLDDRGTHQTICSLGVDGNNLVIGYGDWTINTGPVKVIGYDLSTLEPVTLMTQPPELGNETWQRIRVFDGYLYLPHTDPTLNNQGAYTTNEGGFWETVEVGENPSMIHTFDVIKFKGLMMACGSMSSDGDGAGVVYTETAPGSREFTRSLLGDIRTGFARFYKFFVRDGGNEVMVQNSAGGLESFVTTDGDNWTAAPSEPLNPANTADDPPPALPDRYAAPGHGTYHSSVIHDGWVYIGMASGVVKRARLPEVPLVSEGYAKNRSAMPRPSKWYFAGRWSYLDADGSMGAGNAYSENFPAAPGSTHTVLLTLRNTGSVPITVTCHIRGTVNGLFTGAQHPVVPGKSVTIPAGSTATVRHTAPIGTGSENGFRCWVTPAPLPAANTLFFDKFLVVDGVYDGLHFDGSTLDNEVDVFNWSGAVGTSESERVPRQ